MQRALNIIVLSLLVVMLAGCTVTATFDFAKPAGADGSTSAAAAPAAATPATPPPPATDTLATATPSPGDAWSAVGVYDTATDQLVVPGPWYVADEIRYMTGRLHDAVSFGDSDLSRVQPMLMLAREFSDAESLDPPRNKGTDVPTWKVFSVDVTSDECQPATSIVWREILAEADDAGKKAVSVADWPVSELCPLPANELGLLVRGAPLASLWVDFMVAKVRPADGGEPQTILYRFVPPPPDEDPGSDDSSATFCEWIDCSTWVGGAACQVLRCNLGTRR